jgi:hypothetical protein
MYVLLDDKWKDNDLVSSASYSIIVENGAKLLHMSVGMKMYTPLIAHVSVTTEMQFL